jgi:hypothetical protein
MKGQLAGQLASKSGDQATDNKTKQRTHLDNGGSTWYVVASSRNKQKVWV